MLREPIPTDLKLEYYCLNQLCKKKLLTNPLIYKGFSYCNRNCKKRWPPVLFKIEAEFDSNLKLVIKTAILLFQSKRRVADVLEINITLLEQLIEYFELLDI